jgi:hypothetical protein
MVDPTVIEDEHAVLLRPWIHRWDLKLQMSVFSCWKRSTHNLFGHKFKEIPRVKCSRQNLDSEITLL